MESVVKPSNAAELPAPSLQSLPPELYAEVVRHVEAFLDGHRQQALLALCLTNQTFLRIVQPLLWADPPDLDGVKRQWQFQRAVALRPDLARAVKSLRLLWHRYGTNSDLLVDISAACSSVRALTLQRGDYDALNEDDAIAERDSDAFASICENLPRLQSLHLSTYTNLGFKPSTSLESRCAPSFSRLTSLRLSGRGAEWLVWPCLAARPLALESLCLTQDVFLDGADDLEQVGKSSPKLAELEIRGHCCCPDDVVRMSRCTPNMRRLRISSLLDPFEVEKRGWPRSQRPDMWLADALPGWPRLEELDLGPGCSVAAVSVRALGSPRCAPLRRIHLNDLDEQDRDLEDAITACVRRHSKTLESLNLNWGRFQVGRQTLQACASASRLEELSVAVVQKCEYKEEYTALIDGLLKTCPRLTYLSKHLLEYSQKPDSWLARAEAAETDDITPHRLGT